MSVRNLQFQDLFSWNNAGNWQWKQPNQLVDGCSGGQWQWPVGDQTDVPNSDQIKLDPPQVTIGTGTNSEWQQFLMPTKDQAFDEVQRVLLQKMTEAMLKDNDPKKAREIFDLLKAVEEFRDG